MDVLKPYVAVDQEGEVLDLEGNVVGKHKGYMHYTIGKRKGFTVHGAHDPHFVVEIRPETNQIVVGPREALECRYVELENVNLFDERQEFDCEVKLRYRTQAVPCHVSIKGNRAKIDLAEPVLGVASGQRGFYDGDKLLGGGWIVDPAQAQNHRRGNYRQRHRILRLRADRPGRDDGTAFPSGDPFLSLLGSFGAFAAGMVMSCGALVFHHIGDRMGGVCLMSSLALMALPTF